MKKTEDFIIRELAGEYIMMPVGKTAQKFSGLILANSVSSFIWRHLEKFDHVEDLAKYVCEEFEVSYEEALKDTSEILVQMRTAGWIED